MRYFFRILIVASNILITVDTVSSQIEEGNKEFSLAGSFMSRKHIKASGAWWMGNLATRIGYLITKNIELEQELLLTKFKQEDVGIMLSSLIAYHFEPKDQESDPILFINGGLGFSNAWMFFPNVIYSSWYEGGWFALNLGGGIKIPLTKPLALRLEYRFQYWFGEYDYLYHTIMIGFSAFFE